MENILDKTSEHQDFGRAISQNMPTQYLDKQNLIIDYTHIVRYTEKKVYILFLVQFIIFHFTVFDGFLSSH